ncbi:hypothetical protein VKT23_016813 [Stygiomarasmius scandens]|uniref:Uncharacterized protein n=1 Tax=Marasmiellus scandens TaxID=2682957 RepID=A0ABR1IY70_9AGAR
MPATKKSEFKLQTLKLTESYRTLCDSENGVIRIDWGSTPVAPALYIHVVDRDRLSAYATSIQWLGLDSVMSGGARSSSVMQSAHNCSDSPKSSA